MKRQPAFQVLEQFVMSKTGHPSECEDLIHISEHFVAVIDGATTKSTRRWGGRTGGQIAARVISDALGVLTPDASARQAVDDITSTIQKIYRSEGIEKELSEDPKQRMTASVVVFSILRQEVWFVGDCQAFFGGAQVYPRKRIDALISSARTAFLHIELARGATVEELLADDRGRRFIWPLLEAQGVLQNNPSAGSLWYPVVDGFPVPNEGILVYDVSHTTGDLVLASDGYPIIKESLKATEETLRLILKSDPLLIGEYATTKGHLMGDASFDDRAYIRLAL